MPGFVKNSLLLPSPQVAIEAGFGDFTGLDKGLVQVLGFDLALFLAMGADVIQYFFLL